MRGVWVIGGLGVASVQSVLGRGCNGVGDLFPSAEVSCIEGVLYGCPV